MNSDMFGTSSGSSHVPVLAQLESTAPRTARTHDISHLCDKNHTLKPPMQSTLIDVADHVYEATFLPKGNASVFNDGDGMWYTKVFPSDVPSSRSDAIYLDSWITEALAKHKRKYNEEPHTKGIADTVDDLIPILSIALHEIARQVTHHCAERGRALEKLWKTYMELFRRVLRQMQASMAQQRTRSSETERRLIVAREELANLRRGHPASIHRIVSELEEEFSKRQEECEEELQNTEQENEQLKNNIRKHAQEIELWYPSFVYYQDSYVKNHIPTVRQDKALERLQGKAVMRKSLSTRRSSRDGEGNGLEVQESEEGVPAEVAIAEDFKRLLAVLAPEKRKAIGQELSFIVEPGAPQKPKGSKSSAKSPQPGNWTSHQSGYGSANDEDAQLLEALKVEVQKQEARMRELRDAIWKIEAQEAALEEARQAMQSSAVSQSSMMREVDDEDLRTDPNPPAHNIMTSLAAQIRKVAADDQVEDLGIDDVVGGLAKAQRKREMNQKFPRPGGRHPADEDSDDDVKLGSVGLSRPPDVPGSASNSGMSGDDEFGEDVDGAGDGGAGKTDGAGKTADVPVDDAGSARVASMHAEESFDSGGGDDLEN